MSAGGLLVVVLAIFAAVAVADSGKEKERAKTVSGTSGPKKAAERNGDKSRKKSRKKDRQKTTTVKKKLDTSGDHPKAEDKRRDGAGTPSRPAKPKQGKTFNLRPENDGDKGKVKIKLPGGTENVPLKKDSSIPVGSVIDATHGSVTLTTVPRADGKVQSATFSGAAFQVTQSKTGTPFTDIRLRGGSFAGCGRPLARRTMAGRLFGAFAATSSKRKVRSLWGSGHGHFRTRGRGGAATVRGTIWLTEDRCDGTLVRVRRGVVSVRDFAKRKTFRVRAGHSHFARLR